MLAANVPLIITQDQGRYTHSYSPEVEGTEGVLLMIWGMVVFCSSLNIPNYNTLRKITEVARAGSFNIILSIAQTPQ